MMKMPDDYIKHLGFTSLEDLIENLYLSSMIEAFKRLNKNEIVGLSENTIRDKLQYELQFNCGKISKLYNDRTIWFDAEAQIITKEQKKKRTDIKFFIPHFLYVVECKRVKGASQSQYINEGINRFISRIYINKTEKYAGMCSFVVAGDIKAIMHKLTKKVSKFYGKEIVNETIGKLDTSFRSAHSKDDSEVYIYHLFFDCRN